LGGEGGTANGRARDGNDIKAWMKARNDHVRALRKNAVHPGRAASGSTSSAGGRNDPRLAAGDLANVAGVMAGLGRGALHFAQGVTEGEQIAQHVLDPFYALLHPKSPAVLPVYQAAVGALHAGKQTALYPAQALHRADVALNPGASPVAPTVAAEARRRFGIGQNQGEVAFDVLSGMTGPEAMAARALPAEEQAARWMAKGLTEPQARYMAEPYAGMGHHYYPRGAKLPQKVGPVPLPKSLAGRPMPLPRVISDSPFNVLKPSGISRGDMYEKHYQVDSKFKAARLPRHLGKSWRGAALGIQKHGLLGRVVHGAPPALKRTVGSAAGGIDGVVSAAHREKRR
jgi:hypothetical protein